MIDYCIFEPHCNSFFSLPPPLALLLHAYIVRPTIEAPLEAGCDHNSDCPLYNACINQRCVDPCVEQDPCARDAFCKVDTHQALCSCPPGYTGDPYVRCNPRECRPSFCFCIFRKKPNSTIGDICFCYRQKQTIKAFRSKIEKKKHDLN